MVKLPYYYPTKTAIRRVTNGVGIDLCNDFNKFKLLIINILN